MTNRFFTFFRQAGWDHLESTKGYHEFCLEHVNVLACVWTDDNLCHMYGDGIEDEGYLGFHGGQLFTELDDKFKLLISKIKA